MDGKIIDKDILNRIPTTRVRNELLLQIDTLINNKESIDTLDLTDLGNLLYQKASKTDNADRYLLQLKEELSSLPVLELVIAFSPSIREMNELVTIAREQISPNIVISIEENPLLIAGAKVSYQGKYYDGSILTKLNNV